MSVASVFDRNSVRWTVGVGLPVLMIALDPVVFRSNRLSVGMPIFGHLKPYGYVATAVAILMMALWLIWPRPSAFASGVFAGGALFASLLGLAIFPFSILGAMFLGIGLLGLTPFLMAAMYSRVAKAAFPQTASRTRRLLGFACGVAVVLGIPGAAQFSASQAMRQSLAEIGSGNPVAGQRAVERLRRWSLVLDLDHLVAVHMSEGDPTRQALIAAAYQELTGQNAARRSAELAD